ncbi:MAG: transposase [Parcubacteria group bacterium]
MRKTEFANGEYYHIYNRGVDKREVFLGEEDYLRFLTSMREFNRVDPIGSLYEKYLDEEKRGLSPHKGDLVPFATVPLVEIVCYCLNPNHYHLILKQLSEGGISKFMLKLSSGYSSYFNKKNKRSGSLFQGPFKSVHIDSNEYLLYLSAYVNKNNFIHGYNKNDNWPYSSLLDYLGERNGKLINKEIILGQFKSADEYKEFLESNALYMREKKELAGYLIEE